jgi:hypothetical protein
LHWHWGLTAGTADARILVTREWRGKRDTVTP